MTLIERKQLIEKITGCKSLRITVIKVDSNIHEEWVLIDKLTNSLTSAFALALHDNVIYKIYYIKPHMLDTMANLEKELTK